VLEAAFLRTLPEREFRCGLAELLKTFLIGDGPAYTAIVSSLKTADFEDAIRRAAAIKARIVAEDPEEHGVRAKLNLGHTFGHAIEHEARLHGADITHGEAVAMGILLAAELSERLGVAQKGLSAQLKADFNAVGLPVECPYPAADLVEALRKDKKAVAGGKVNFVLLRAPGDVILQELPYDCYLHTK
jgi:3-dehydroquinate synthetase